MGESPSRVTVSSCASPVARLRLQRPLVDPTALFLPVPQSPRACVRRCGFLGSADERSVVPPLILVEPLVHNRDPVQRVTAADAAVSVPFLG